MLGCAASLVLCILHVQYHQGCQQLSTSLLNELHPASCSSVQFTNEKGASIWLTCLSLKYRDFFLHSVMLLLYIITRCHLLLPLLLLVDIHLQLNMPYPFHKVDFHLCSTVKFVTYLTAKIMTEVRYNVIDETHLQPLW